MREKWLALGLSVDPLTGLALSVDLGWLPLSSDRFFRPKLARLGSRLSTLRTRVFVVEGLRHGSNEYGYPRGFSVPCVHILRQP